MSVNIIGGLNLYDPNEGIGGNEYSAYGINPGENNAVNQEDLIMYCNLRAFTRPRSYIMNSNIDGVKTQAVASARINFLKPNKDKDKFTTDWTELDASGRPNGDEMLGINSVQITYDTSYVPRVTITMTDVRGQALNEDPKDSPYGAFFNFPYPMFVLEVKGYYGKAVKYLLHLLKYSSRFDYSTGNYQITCEFVGFTYALLSDLNVQYGLIASQMVINGKSGKERLRKKFELQIEKYKDIPGFSDDIKNIIGDETNLKGGCYTLVDLINKSKELATFVENLNQDSGKFREKAILDNFIDKIRLLYDAITKGEVINSKFNEDVKDINGDSLFIEFPNYNSELKCDITAPTDKVTEIISQNIKDSYIKYYNNSFNIISERNNDIGKELDDEVKSGVSGVLGFKPSIRNIMLIICNNFELFLDLLTETTQNAGGNLNRKNTLTQIMKDGDPKRSNKKLENVYPWPALFDDNYNICYFDDLPTLNVNDYPEKEFVESFLNATQFTNKLLESSGDTTSISSIITESTLFNPIHTQQYSDLKTPIFDVDIKKALNQIIEHALLISSNSWSENPKKQITSFGKADADNLYKSLGNKGINSSGGILTKNLSWINDSKDNSVGNGDLGILQAITEVNTIMNTIKNDAFDIIKNQFHYIKDYKSNYLTDIVETDDIINLKGKYKSLEGLRFVPEVKNNTLGVGDYGAGSVKTENNGFISYEKINKFSFPKKISLQTMFKPFMVEETNEVMGIKDFVFNKTMLEGEEGEINLLKSLKFVLFNLQVVSENLSEPIFGGFGFFGDDVLKNIPGVTDTLDEFILFNGIHKTKMVNALSYLFFIDEDYMNPNGPDNFKKPFYYKYNYYFPFTTNKFPDSYENQALIYLNNRRAFLSVYRELIEKVVDIMNGAPTVRDIGVDGRITDTDLYYTYIRDSDNPQKSIMIDKDGNPSQYSNQDRNKAQYAQIYQLIEEFFDVEIQMVSKSNGLSDINKNLFNYWTDNNDFNSKSISSGKGKVILYNGKRYNLFKGSYLIDSYLTGFRNRMVEIVKTVTDEDKNNPENGSNTVSVKTNSDLKRSLYQTFKNINDKWVIDYKDGDKIKYSWGLEGDVDSNNDLKYNNNREFLFDHFFFVDRVNRDIGDDLLLDFRVLKNYYDQVNSKNSLYSIIGELAKMNEMIFHPLTSYIDFNGKTSNSGKVSDIDGLFKPIPTLDFQSTSPVFIMQYIGKSASYQYENQNHLPDVIKIDFSNNRFENPPNSPFIKKEGEEKNWVNESVAFFVDMGIKNQNMFKGISLDQAEFRETNESITVWDQLTSQKESRSIQTIGNNIYPILSRRSYSCKVESLGNMMIQPTMYFYLRYVPLFSGLYLITKVSHSIQPNNVVTNFEGVRMSSLNFPLVSEFISTLTKEILEKGTSDIIFTTKEDPNFWDNLRTNSPSRGRIIAFYNIIKNIIPNHAVQAALIAIAYKESELLPKDELEKEVTGTEKHSFFKSFKNLENMAIGDSNDPSREISPFVNELKKYPIAFYNFVYGTNPKAKEIGNIPKTAKLNPINITDSNGKVITVYNDSNGDGYKYKARGYNGITGRPNYENAKTDTGVDVVENPNLLNNLDTAAKAYVGYMNRGAIGLVRSSTKSNSKFYEVYSHTPLKDFDKNNYHKAYNTIFSINSGPNNSMEVHLSNDTKKGGYNKGYFILQSIYNAIKDGKIK